MGLCGFGFGGYKEKIDPKIVLVSLFQGRLCTFYNDKQKEKFSRRLNSTLYDVYSQRQKLDFYNEVNFNFVDEFIGRNKEKFETYKPCKIGNKYLMYF